MSKRNTADVEPSNALIMRTLNTLNSKFDNLPTIDHLTKLENDLHNKIESNTKALKDELRSEFRQEIGEQVAKMTNMIGEVRAQVDSNTASRNNNQMGRYLRARRSFKIWPLDVDTRDEAKLEQAVRKFFINRMSVPNRTANSVALDTIRPADQARNSKVVREYVITFADVESRDAIKSYAAGLASANGEAGLRLDIPPCLKGSFKVLNDHGISMLRMYGKGVKRNIKFDDRNSDLMMDIKLPTSETWHNITIEQARDAKKTRDALDMRNIRQAALGAAPGQASVHPVDREKARALMLAISPSQEKSNQTGNFQSVSGVVHINSEQDWRNFEAEQGSDNDSHDRSIEEILGTRGARSGARRKTASSSQENRERS